MSDSIRNFTSWVHDLLGVSPVHIEHGELTRFGPKKCCYCKLWPDGLGGFAGDFKNGIFATWSAIDPERMSHSQRLAHEARIAQAKAERDREQAARWEGNRPRLRSTWDASHKLMMGDPVTLYVKRRVQGGMWPLPACGITKPCPIGTTAKCSAPSLRWWRASMLLTGAVWVCIKPT